MKSFSTFLKETFIVEGGNCPVISRETGEVLDDADRIDTSKINRKQLQDQLINLFRVLNTKFKNKYGTAIWNNFDVITKNQAFNGSSKHFFDDEITDEEFREVKKSMGDVDVIIPHGHLKKLYDLLADEENQRMTKDFIYLGQNKPKFYGHQINSVFQLQSPKINVQIDFEGTEYTKNEYTKKDEPSEFAKFAHSSDWEDVRSNIKGYGHKILLVNIARAISKLKDALVITPNSPTEPVEDIRISNSASAKMPTNLAFSVDHGIRIKYEPLKDSKGNLIKIDGKQVYRELPTDPNKYEKNIGAMFTLIFDRKPEGNDLKDFGSFSGIMRLFKSKNIDKKIIEDTFISMLDKTFFGRGAQGIDAKDKNVDRDVKMKIVNKMISEFDYLQKIFDSRKEQIEKYYDNYKTVEDKRK